MESIRSQSPQTALITLEMAAASTRGSFACLFSTADEYESALICERRAQGRYRKPRARWPMALFAVSVLMVAGVALLLS